MEFRLLGPLEASDEGRPIRLGGPKQRTVLAHLLLRAGEAVQPDRLIDHVWGETPPEAAQNVLQTYVSHLRKALGPGRLERTSGGYVLRVEPVEVDALRFASLVERARAVDDPAEAARTYAEALSLWRGPAALSDLADRPSLRPHITRLDELRVEAAEERVEADLACGRHAEVVGELERLVSEHPLREGLRAQLMLALYRSGRQAEALEACRYARSALVEELGIEPGPRLRELEQAILRQDPSLDPPPAGPRTEPGPPTNLPAQLTSFVGREPEIAEVRGLLERSRLVTLTGPGGCGKTRLALQVAAELVPAFPDGVFLVRLASLRDPSLIVPTIASTLGVKERPDQPLGETLAKHLAPKDGLLVLDNFEHLVEGAAAVTRLLEAAPGVTALVTSRELLRLSGEREFPVPPLRLPDPSATHDADRLAGLDSVALFVERAEVADPRFRLTDDNAAAVAEICRRLDGLPLSIELAASMIRRFDPATLLERLADAISVLTEGPRDAPARHQTLRNTIAWSYELLSDAERRIFRTLGIFLRGWTIEAARQVVDHAGDPDGDLHEAIGPLVDKNLVVRDTADPERMRMLETIREFARAEMEGAGEYPDAARRHAMFFLRLAEEAEPHLVGSEQAAWLDRIEADHDNLRAALRSTIGSEAAPLGMRLAAALWRFWLLRGHLREGRAWLEQVLSIPGAGDPTGDRMKALTALGGLAYWQADYRSAGEAYREALEIARGLDDVSAEAAARYNLGYIALIEGDLDEAWGLFTGARGIHDRLGDRSAFAYDGMGLGLVAVRRGDFRTAREVHEEAIAVFRELEDRFGLGSTLTALARSYAEGGDADRARQVNEEALTLFREAGDLAGIAMALGSEAERRVAVGDPETGVRLGGAASAIEEQIGGGAPEPVRTYRDARILAAELLDPGTIARAWDAGRDLSVDGAVALVLGPSVAPARP